MEDFYDTEKLPSFLITPGNVYLQVIGVLSTAKVRVNWLELCHGTSNVWYYPEKADVYDVAVKNCKLVEAPVPVGKKNNRWTFKE